MASADAIDDSDEAIAAGTQWSETDSIATNDGAGYDSIAYAVDLVSSSAS